MVIGENAPMFHPNCKCSTAAHMDRREVEQLFADYEKSLGLSDEERLQNALNRVSRNEEALTRANVPKGMQMKLSEAEMNAYSSDEFVQHAYDKHKQDYGNLSEKNYVEYALKMAHDDSSSNQKYTRVDGTVVKYNKKTNDLLIILGSGELRTLYKPRGGSMYYERDKRNHEK